MNTYRRKINLIAQTAVILALLIGVQFVSRSFGQFVTGSLVNMILLICVFIIGLKSSLIVAVASPFLAFLAGIGIAIIQIIPFISVGNVIFVLFAGVIRKYIEKKQLKSIVLTVAGLLSASIAKTAFLWIVLVQLALPVIPGINEKQIVAISAAFTWPQLVTSIIGSTLAITVVPILRKAKLISDSGK